MEVNEEIKQKLVKNLKNWLDDTVFWMDHFIQLIESAETVEDIMKFKRDLLTTYIGDLPVSDKYCYFCLLHEREMYSGRDCINCEYAKHHKMCNDLNSDWRRIIAARNELMNVIDKLYYRGGEKYE